MAAHETFVVRKMNGAAQAHCRCGWSTVWIATEGAVELAEAEARDHEA